MYCLGRADDGSGEQQEGDEGEVAEQGAVREKEVSGVLGRKPRFSLDGTPGRIPPPRIARGRVRPTVKRVSRMVEDSTSNPA